MEKLGVKHKLLNGELVVFAEDLIDDGLHIRAIGVFVNLFMDECIFDEVGFSFIKKDVGVADFVFIGFVGHVVLELFFSAETLRGNVLDVDLPDLSVVELEPLLLVCLLVLVNDERVVMATVCNSKVDNHSS